MMALNKYFDHTLLKPDATDGQIKTLCQEAREYDFYSVCINSCHVNLAAKELAGCHVEITAVVGFPLGACTTKTKAFETEEACKAGASEIDMVINLGWVKDQKWDDLLAEIKAVKAACKGKLLKVIIECCFLTDEEKIKMCEIVTASGAEYIKTSTGFGTGGATREDVALFAKHVGPNVKIKAAGGIRTFQQAQAMLDAGADRIGASALVGLFQQEG